VFRRIRTKTVHPGSPTFDESGFSYDPRFRDISEPVRLRGYFQSPRYFNVIKREVLTMFSLPEPNPVLEEIAANVGPDFFAIHVRRGDYLNPATQAFHGTFGAGYYLRAIELVARASPSRHPIVAFSDEPARIPAELRAVTDHVVSVDADRPPALDMLAMSRASGLVMSNSSFSWWAGFLADTPNRAVVAPRPWLRSGDAAASDLLLAHWMSLGDPDYGSAPG
jgi:hypothetical protein